MHFRHRRHDLALLDHCACYALVLDINLPTRLIHLPLESSLALAGWRDLAGARKRLGFGRAGHKPSQAELGE